MNRISLQISGRQYNLGYRTILNINWEGADMPDTLLIERNYIGNHVYAMSVDERYETYQLFLTKVDPGDGRTAPIQFTLRIPAQTEIIDSENNVVSPAAILRPIAQKYEKDCLRRIADILEYRRGSENILLSTPDYEAFIEGYRTRPIWGRHKRTEGTGTLYISAAAEQLVDDTILALPFYKPISGYGRVETGNFASSVQARPLTKGELEYRPPVEVQIYRNDGLWSSPRKLENTPEHLKSSNFGYETDEYTNVEVVLYKETVLDAFYNSKLLNPANATLEIHSSENTVTVRFSPPLRTKTYTIEVKGGTDGEYVFNGKIFFNHSAEPSNQLTLKGKAIKEFEKLNADALLEAFKIEDSNFLIEKIRRDNTTIAVTLKCPAADNARKLKETQQQEASTRNSSQSDNTQNLPLETTVEPQAEQLHGVGSSVYTQKSPGAIVKYFESFSFVHADPVYVWLRCISVIIIILVVFCAGLALGQWINTSDSTFASICREKTNMFRRIETEKIVEIEVNPSGLEAEQQPVSEETTEADGTDNNEADNNESNGSDVAETQHQYNTDDNIIENTQK